jgi:xylulokinase
VTDNPLFLGVDVSTTGAKALIVDSTGQVISSATTPLALSTPRPLWAEQDPEHWRSGVWNSIRQALEQSGLDPAAIAAIGLTGQMHGLVLLDEAGRVLRPAILWNDQRTGQQCDEIRRRLGKPRLIEITGNDALAGFTAPKILWVREHEPEVYARARHMLLPKDYVRYCLTGELAMDKADGSGTLLFDLKARHWSPEVLAALDIPAGWLPTTFEGPEITGRLSRKAAIELGLAPGLPVVAGGGDQSAQAVGVGAIEPGLIALTLGTSGVVFAPANQPLFDPEGRLHAFCHALPGCWHLMGVMLSAAGSLQWHHDLFAPGISYETLLDEAAAVPPGCEGLLFLPYLSGERTPHPDPLARGAWVGLTVRHGRGHLTRAVLEGVAFGLKDNFELVRQTGLSSVDQVRLSGGGAKSRLWVEILASVLEAELATVNAVEGAAYGAALLAGVGAGAWSSAQEACTQAISITGRVAPSPEMTEVYRRVYPFYRELYPTLRPVFHR